MARMSNRTLEMVVGTFIVGGVIVIAGMILTVSNFSLWSRTYKVVIQINHIGDLQVGAPTKRGGVQIGRVDAISLKKDHIEIVVDIDDKVELAADTKARIETAGVVGDTFLEFTQGKSTNPLKKFQTIEDARNNFVDGVPVTSLTELLAQLQGIGVEVNSIAQNVNDIIGDDKVKQDIRDTIHNVNGLTIEAKKLITSLGRAAKNVEEASTDIVVTTGQIKKMASTVEVAINDTIGDKRNREAINETLANLRAVSRSIASKHEQIEATIDNVKGVTDKAKEMAAAFDQNKGIMKLFTSDATDKWLDSVAADIKKVADTISKVGFTDILADNKAADRIFQQFQKENRSGDAKEIWKKWMEFRAKVVQETGHLVDPKFGKGGWREEFGNK